MPAAVPIFFPLGPAFPNSCLYPPHLALYRIPRQFLFRGSDHFSCVEVHGRFHGAVESWTCRKCRSSWTVASLLWHSCFVELFAFSWECYVQDSFLVWAFLLAIVLTQTHKGCGYQEPRDSCDHCPPQGEVCWGMAFELSCVLDFFPT